MRLLPESFDGRSSQKGWHFKLVERHGKYAIFEKTSKSSVYYEVVVIRVKKAMQAKYPNGTVVDYPEREVYPTDEEFGTYGWSYGSFEAAKAQLEALIVSAIIE